LNFASETNVLISYRSKYADSSKQEEMFNIATTKPGVFPRR